MMHAYHEMYLNRAQSALGTVFDYAINTCKINGEDFLKMFVVSNICERFEKGESAVVSGKSGIEIAREIIFEATGEQLDIESKYSFARTKEYWIGWAVAYYQWYSNRKYIEIFNAVSYNDFDKMYYTLHEADISKFVDIVDKKVKEYYSDTNLKRIRTAYGITQSELAKRADVKLRSIQMYEQRNKDINKASVETIYSIANVLGCTVEDLIEK